VTAGVPEYINSGIVQELKWDAKGRAGMKSARQCHLSCRELFLNRHVFIEVEADDRPHREVRKVPSGLKGKKGEFSSIRDGEKVTSRSGIWRGRVVATSWSEACMGIESGFLMKSRGQTRC